MTNKNSKKEKEKSNKTKQKTKKKKKVKKIIDKHKKINQIKNKKILIYNQKINEQNELKSSLRGMNFITQNINLKDKRSNELNDWEINSLPYKEALILDKRTYFQYYISLLKRKQVLIFTFYTNNDYNLRIIKICLFIFSFSLDYTVNTLFYNDSTMHKIYEDEGEYNFLSRLPTQIYSLLITNMFSTLIEYLALCEEDMIKIKKEENNDSNIISIKRCIKIKFIIFNILSILLMLFFWYYISCFGAIYKNTQIHLLKDVMFSFSISLLIPFGQCLLPGIFRIPSLRKYNENKECLYKISQFV